MEWLADLAYGLAKFVVTVVVLMIAWVLVGFGAHAVWFLLWTGWRLFAHA